jgi:hypothetical protein
MDRIRSWPMFHCPLSNAPNFLLCKNLVVPAGIEPALPT